ncbi:MAG TPA: MMPL family transporter [Capillimicrobium sp.]|nr:MMPL family transporter [Capillimicrobium sp.]
MAGLLERLGRFCARHRLAVLGVWALALVGLILAASSLGTRTSDDLSLPGTGSQDAADIFASQFPEQQNASGPVVFEAREGAGPITSKAHRDAIAATLKRIGEEPHVASVSDPFSTPGAVSGDRRIAYATVTLDLEPPALTRDLAEDLVRTAHEDDSMRVAVGGVIGDQASAPDTEGSEVIGLAAAVIILLLTFGTVVAMGLPILTALLGLAAGLALVTVLGHVIAVPTIGPTLATMIGLGVGIDYALFLITRHRAHLAEGMGVEEAIGRTVGTSGSAVVFAGGTVIIALLSLALARIPIVAALGYTSAIVVAVAVLAAITLLPAVLGLLGRRVNALRVPLPHRRGAHSGHGDGRSHGWARWAETVARRPWPWLVAGLALLLVLAAPTLGLRLGEADDGTAPKGSDQRIAYDLLARGFGEGTNGPLIVAVRLDSANAATSQQALDKLATELGKAPGVAAASPPIPSKSGTAALITVTPTTAPGDHATENLVSRLRDSVIPQATAGTGLHAYVGGETAGYVDLADEISDRLPQVILTVIALSFLLLMLAFRSLVLPLKAAAMNLLSIGAAYGVVTAVFQEGWGASLIGLEETIPIVSFVPLMMFAILFGLSMDYEVFLLSQVQEHWRAEGDARRAVVEGLASTGRVITAAACIMVCVFGSFVLNDNATIKQFGLGMAVAVAVDATVVRCLLVPSVMVLLGRASWWLPPWLDRHLPHLDVEGRAAPSTAAGD